MSSGANPKPTLTIAVNNVVAKVVGATDGVKDFLTDKLSYMVEGAEFMTAFSTVGWNGRTSLFNRVSNTFPAGFLHLIHNELVAAGHTVRVVRRPAVKPLGPEHPIVDEFGNDDPRYDFQLKALRQVEKHGRGIIQVATGGGKSKIAKLIVARYRRMTMFITTRGVLMYQMRDAFVKDCKFNVGVIGDGEWSPTRGVNVGMVQTFVSHLKMPVMSAEVGNVVAQVARKEIEATKEQIHELAKHRFDEKFKVRERMIKLLSLVEVVIGEEAHEAGGNSYYEILRHCPNASIRVALTATPFMRADAEDNMRLMAAFGPILLKVSEKVLIDRGILAKPYFLFANPAPHSKLRKTSPWERAYSLEVIDGPGRNSTVVHYAKKGVQHGLPVMVLVVRKKHGLKLVEDLKAAGVSARFMQGENNQKERKRALTELGNGELEVLIGTTILDVGVDVPAVGLVILAGGYKGEIGVRQRIGRGLRAKKAGPNVAFILDFSDQLNSTLRDHARQRRAIIEGTPGFVENILPPGVDFPWDLFSAAAKRAA